MLFQMTLQSNYQACLALLLVYYCKGNLLAYFW